MVYHTACDGGQTESCGMMLPSIRLPLCAALLFATPLLAQAPLVSAGHAARDPGILGRDHAAAGRLCL